MSNHTMNLKSIDLNYFLFIRNPCNTNKQFSHFLSLILQSELKMLNKDEQSLKNYLSQMINEQLAFYISKMEEKIEKLEKMCQRIDQQVKTQKEQINLLDIYYRQFWNQQEDLKRRANVLLEKTERKIKEIKKIKKTQDTFFSTQTSTSYIQQNQSIAPILENVLQQYSQNSAQFDLQASSVQEVDQIVYEGTGNIFHKKTCIQLKNEAVIRDSVLIRGLAACQICKP